MKSYNNVSREDFIKNLRALANFYMRHPNVPTPKYGLDLPFIRLDTKDELLAAIKGCKRVEKKYDGDDLDVVITVVPSEQYYGEVRIRMSVARDQVCLKKVTGTKKIAARVVPEYTIPEHEEEIVEWECNPLLKPTKERERD